MTDNVVDLCDCMPHVVVNTGDCVHVIPMQNIRRIASGEYSIAEYEEPEIMAQCLAVLAMESINAN